MTNDQGQTASPTLLGHPAGLFTLFFAEMWERFSFYGMRALLVLYMMKGFLEYRDNDAYTLYGAYTALVYMAPFFGGMLADKILGARRAVILGGLLMACGQGLLMVQDGSAFFTGLALLICGNGFFKPNISTIVGALYRAHPAKRDGGFTIFYMGVNLGAAMSPLLCGYIGETFGWHWGFGLATIGMFTGLAVFANWAAPGDAGQPPDRELLRRRPVLISQILLVAAALTGATLLFVYHPQNPFSIAVNVFVGAALLLAAAVACRATWGSQGALITVEWAIYLGAILAVPLFVLLVSGFAPLTADGRGVTIVPDSVIAPLKSSEVMQRQLKKLEAVVKQEDETAVAKLSETFDELAEDLKSAEAARENLKKLRENTEAKDEAAIAQLVTSLSELDKKRALRAEQVAALRAVAETARAKRWADAQNQVEDVAKRFPLERVKVIVAVVLQEVSRPAGLILILSGLIAFVYLGLETIRLEKIPRERMYVVLILTFFSMLFWSFFEQAGSSLNNFTDRNVDRVFERRRIQADEVGQTIRLQPTQEQIGYRNGNDMFTIGMLDALRAQHDKDTKFQIDWHVTEGNRGMGVAERLNEIPTSTFQAVNPIYILVFGLAFSALWTFLGARGLEPSTTVKFAMGLLQLGLGFGAFWYGAQQADERGMVSLGWLFLGYLLHTSGELCLSPVGLSMITRLSPARMVSTVMGVWFLATAFSQFLAAIIAQFTGVTHAEEGGGAVPPPIETVNVYGDVFGKIALAALISAVVCFLLAPILNRWMHPEVEAKA